MSYIKKEEFNDEAINQQDTLQNCQYELLTKPELDLLDKIGCVIVKSATDGQTESDHICQFWAYFANILFMERGNYIKKLNELEKQKLDLEHFLTDQDPESEEYIKILKSIGDVVKERRVIKDRLSYMSVAHENINKIAGFINKGQTRRYSPRSLKYGGNVDLGTDTGTKVKIDSTSIKPPRYTNKGKV